MAGVELRSCPGVRGCFVNLLWLNRPPPKISLSDYPIALGQRGAAAHLFLGAALVPARTRRDLFNRLRVALGSSGRTCRQQWDVARQSIPLSSSGPGRTTRLRTFAHLMLV